MTLRFGRDTCGNLEIARSREWLATNGIGGYASGTVAGMLTRRYHGLLVAALEPPLGRMVLLNQLDEMVQYDRHFYPLYTNRWADGTVAPQGYRDLESFALDGTIPTWTFACADALLDKRIWMQSGENTTYIRYTLRRGSNPLILSCKAFANYRDFHSETYGGDWQMQIEAVERGVCVRAFPTATPFYLFAQAERLQPTTSKQPKVGVQLPKWTLNHTWYRNFDLAMERDRGLVDCEDRLHAATLEVMLNPGDSLTVVASTQAYPNLDGSAALETRHRYEQDLLTRWRNTPNLPTAKAPPWIEQLVLAADQFVVNRPLPNEPDGKTILAGYHWFGDWGRDTMISLPGLTLATGRPEIARIILRTFARYLDRGMLPNLFPDAGEAPLYNTADATLWYFEAIRAYYAATGDRTLLQELFPALVEIIDCHRRGTRYNIHLDPEDGLLYAGETGVQLTWMDAKIKNWVVTPRIGKPIEINALWYNALAIAGKFARLLGRSDRDFGQMAKRTARGFGRFWYSQGGYCYDVLDGPKGDDASLRPNQIFAVSLPTEDLLGTLPLLSPTQQRSVVKTVARSLLTSHGLRSLAPEDPQYQGIYSGNLRKRDGSYHQGTTWGWLLGPFVRAHLKVYNDRDRALEFLEPMARHLQNACVGNLSEIFDGNAPMTPRGAVAQAWTVAEVLCAWQACHEIEELGTEQARRRLRS